MKKLYFNGDFVPMTTEEASFEALLVAEDGTIAFTGSLDEARSLAEGCEEIDLEGKTVMPGLIDPHSHISGTTQYLTAAQLENCTSYDEIIAAMKEFAEARNIGEDGIIMGVAYDHNSLAEGKHPNRHVLDQVSTEIPVICIHASSHMCVANTKLLELAGITAETPNPEGAQYGREEGNVPDGYCEEPNAMWPIFAVVGPRNQMDMDKLILEMQDIYMEHGITTCQEGATTNDFVDLFAHFADANLLKMDVVSYPMYGEDVDAALEKHARFDSQEYTNHFRIGGLKMFLDGSPQGRTAWMSEPYTPGDEGDDYCGYGTMTDEAAYEFIRKAIDGNHQVLSHTNGDQAAEQYITQYTRALADSPNPEKANLRPVLIHAQTARKDQYERMAGINMIPSIFASHIWYWGDIHVKNFGPVRAGRISAVRDAIDNNLHPTFHTDTPVLRPNFFEEVWCAVVRQTKDGVQLDEDQKCSVFEGLQCITINGAYQYGEEDRKGTLEVGKLADLCITEKNPLKVSLDELRDLKVVETVKEGETIWHA